ncbi:MAG: M23 family metallopeptidase [Solirubrobacterales bacterium]|nr:M23 family metallopeptidase [Solirubrobacterales bacterium]
MTFAEQCESGDLMSMAGDSARPARRHSGSSRSMISIAARASLPLARLRVWSLAALASGSLLVCVSAASAAAAALKVDTLSGRPFQSAGPSVTIVSPRDERFFGLHRRVIARFGCSEGGTTAPIATCTGTVAAGQRIGTSTPGTKAFTVTATDRAGNTVTKTVHYTVLRYTNPLRAVRGLRPGRIDQGVDYAGSGPILALGSGTVIKATNTDSGWPGGGWLLYQLSQGPFAGKYVFVSENITVSVKAGQTVTTGEKIATLHDAYPNMETGWASGIRDTTLANADGHLCPCADPGGWSTIEGRNFGHLLVVLGARSGYLQPDPPKQRMPPGWPRLSSPGTVAAAPESRTPLPEGWTARPK